MYQNYLNQPMQQAYNSYMPKQEIVRVHGENGARAFRMAPNSSALLLDDTDSIIWFVQTDGAGYQTVTPFSYAPYQPAPPVDVADIDKRLKRLEEMFNAKSDPVNAESAASA